VNGTHAVPTQYLTVEEVCSRRRCSRSTLYAELKRYRKSGGVAPMPTPFKWGRRTYFVEAEVDACLLAYADNARNQ
jgi:predicted DNA-binding transcriptional regulator AlpA